MSLSFVVNSRLRSLLEASEIDRGSSLGVVEADDRAGESWGLPAPRIYFEFPLLSQGVTVQAGVALLM